jgi:hypothetical protein
MFASGFSLGFTISDIQTQVSALLANAVVLGLVAGSLALTITPRIISVVKGMWRH